ncbi:MAG: hypothetical protein RMJ33_10255 [Saprospiraceae bacterium]|nr:hypothetical protein [Saprospiraceae bacterium]MDW8230208.1 hypothetical protein [Saprospiraceae bacterium]
MTHAFTNKIEEILFRYFEKNAQEIFKKSVLLQYLNYKTRSANRGSKSRASFANLYAIYVLIKDYLEKGFDKNEGYSNYEGALFSNLLTKQRQLPFGEKLQNHALNNRVNSEFQRLFPETEWTPILRNLSTNRYWINENLLKVHISNAEHNIARAIAEIIEEYIKAKQTALQNFLEACKKLQNITAHTELEIQDFIRSLLSPETDARLFEIASYAILKYFYHGQIIIWGFDLKKLKEENLKLYKTGRTNANDGGIDFVMRPIGRFFQVTESLDVKKYFLDIDKIQRYPITFVIKSNDTAEAIQLKIKEKALKAYPVHAIVSRYMDCIEEIISIPLLLERFHAAVKRGHLKEILDEIILQSTIEFNYNPDA